MTLADKVPVESLAPERLERLERRVVAAAGPALARPQRPTLWPWGLALAGAAAGAIAMYAMRPAPAAPSAPPLAVATDARGATLTLGDATILAGPDTAYDVVRADGGVDVRLARGAVYLDVAPRAGRPPLWVHAGDVGVRVVGTAFTVTRAPDDGLVSVEVAHGTVEVHQAGTMSPVTAGQRWSSRDGTVLAVAPASGPQPPPRPAVSSGGRIGDTATRAGDHATGPAIDVAVLPDRDRPAVAPGAGAGATSRATQRNGSKPGHGGAAAKPDAVPAETPGDLLSELRRAPLPTGTSVATGTATEREGTLRSRYANSVRDEAAAALYTLARLQFVELGKEDEALKTLDLYATRFPTGAERDDAMWLRVRILCGRAFTNRCKAAAHSYVKAFGQDLDLDLLAASAPPRVRLANRVTKQP